MSVIHIKTTESFYCSSEEEEEEISMVFFHRLNNNTKKPFTEDSGFDLYCPEDVTIPPMSIGYKLGLNLSTTVLNNGKRLPYLLYPRSSTGSKTPLRLSNSVGIIDSGYTGEICALIDNISDKQFNVVRGSRLFQLVQFSGEPFAGIKIVKEHPESTRGSGGFGSTGK
jgi:dUTP pyrophosphatase